MSDPLREALEKIAREKPATRNVAAWRAVHIAREALAIEPEPTREYEYRAVRTDPYRKTSWWPTMDDASVRARAAGWRDWKFERRVAAGKPERVQ